MDSARRRNFLRIVAGTGALGLAGCNTLNSGDGNETPAANPVPDNADFEFDYAGGEVTVEYVGSDPIPADQLIVQSSDEEQVRWYELGSTSTSSDGDVTVGNTATIGSAVLNWPSEVEQSEIVRVVYMNSDGSPTTLARFEPEEGVSGTSRETETPTDAPAEISAIPEFRLDDSLPSRFENGAVTRSSTDSAVGNYAWRFDGSSQILTDYVWREAEQSGTLCTWVYIPASETDNENNRCILSAHDGGSYADYNGEILGLFQFGEGDGVGLYRRTQNDSIAVRTTDFPTDEWFHLASVIDTSRNEVRTYIDGQLRDSAPDIDFDDMEQEPVFGIGAQYRQSGNDYDIRRYFVGRLDDVQIYEEPLSKEDIHLLIERR
ncbi:LamG domain-containing protein [Haloarcula sp. AONF1]